MSDIVRAEEPIVVVPALLLPKVPSICDDDTVDHVSGPLSPRSSLLPLLLLISSLVTPSFAVILARRTGDDGQWSRCGGGPKFDSGVECRRIFALESMVLRLSLLP